MGTLKDNPKVDLALYFTSATEIQKSCDDFLNSICDTTRNKFNSLILLVEGDTDTLHLPKMENIQYISLDQDKQDLRVDKQ